jgi:hypothetical protein
MALAPHANLLDRMTVVRMMGGANWKPGTPSATGPTEGSKNSRPAGDEEA